MQARRAWWMPVVVVLVVAGPNLGAAVRAQEADALRVEQVTERDGRLEVVVVAPDLLTGSVLGSDAFSAAATTGGATQPVEVDAARLADEELAVVLVVDPALPAEALRRAKGAAAEFAVGLPSPVEVGVVVASDPPFVALEPSTDREVATQRIGAIAAEPVSSPYPALGLAVDQLSEVDVARPSVVAVLGSESPIGLPPEIPTALEAIGASVQVLTVPGAEEVAAVLERSAGASGVPVTDTSGQGFVRAHDQVARRLLSQYRLALTPPPTSETLVVSVDAAGQRATAAVALPTAPSAPATVDVEDEVPSQPARNDEGSESPDVDPARVALGAGALLMLVGLVAARRRRSRAGPARPVAAPAPPPPTPVPSPPTPVPVPPPPTPEPKVDLAALEARLAREADRSGPGGQGSNGVAVPGRVLVRTQGHGLPVVEFPIDAPLPTLAPARPTSSRPASDPVVISSPPAPAAPVAVPTAFPPEQAPTITIGSREERSAARLSEAMEVLADALEAGLALPEALRLAGRSSRGGMTPLFIRVAEEVQRETPLDQAVRNAQLQRNEAGLRWFALAGEAERTTGGTLPALVRKAAGTVAARVPLAMARRALHRREQLLATTLPVVPLAVVLFRQWGDAAYLERLVDGSFGPLRVAAAVVLTLVGAWWLRRVGREPLAVIVPRWRDRFRTDRREWRTLETLDRAALFAAGGQELDDAVSRAAGHGPGAARPSNAALRRLRQAYEDGGATSDELVIQAEAERLRHELEGAARQATRRAPLAAALPVLGCLVPAVLLVSL